MAEQHAVTFAAGLASQGMLPVVCIYSTFLQRSYDQIIHDVNLLRENVVFAIDRAGFVPADGETHQGIYDPAFLSQLGMPLYAPSNYQELNYWLQQLLSDRFHGPRAIRYPRGGQDAALAEFGCTGEDYDFLRKADDATIVLVGIAVFGAQLGGTALTGGSLTGATGPAAVYSNLLIIAAGVVVLGLVWFLVFHKHIYRGESAQVQKEVEQPEDVEEVLHPAK